LSGAAMITRPPTRPALGNHANNSAAAGQRPGWDDAELAEKARRDRRARHELLDKLRPLTSLPRVAKCMKIPRSAAGVGVRIGDGTAGFSGVCTCASVWACPVHAAKIGAERAREELTPVIKYVIDDAGGSVVHATFTVAHTSGIPLAETRKAVQSAWEFLLSSRRWRLIDKEFDRLGFTRAFETTWGKENGWHPHLHVLLYLGNKIETEECLRLVNLMFDVYQRGLERHGFTCSFVRGIHAEVATTRRDADVVLGKYMTKIASEITRQDKKQAQGGRFTPFDLLREAVDQGNADMLDLWHEYEQATFGTKLLTWSGRRKEIADIRTLAGLRREKTDQEIADDELGDPIAVVIPTEEWRGVWWRRTQLLDAAELGGAGAAVDWLTERGIRWELPPPKVRAWRPDAEITRELLRRSARTVLRT